MAGVDIDLELYHRQGFLAGFQIFEEDECPRLLELYWRLRKLLPSGMSTQEMDWWHATDRELWELCKHPKILDYVESILGPDFFLWGTQFFSKEPRDGKTTPWHQDAFYWPLSPHKTVTVWLAFSDSDEGNGAMMVVPGSHRAGKLKYRKTTQDSDVLDMVLEHGEFRESNAVPLILKAGQISLHDDNIIHGSAPNHSERLRCGLTMRYSAGEVRGDLSVWPFFKAFWVRGVDRWGHNPVGVPPKGEMTRYIQVAG
jgi:non-heme Fe2+,alpha-ketoglutarate-dependent halogenase